MTNRAAGTRLPVPAPTQPQNRCTCNPDLANHAIHDVACPHHGLAAFMDGLRKVPA